MVGNTHSAIGPFIEWAGDKTQMPNEVLPNTPLSTAAEIGLARKRLKGTLSRFEEAYAQFQGQRWKEISRYMSLLLNGGGKDGYDADFMPISSAGGEKGGLCFEFGDFVLMVEATMSTSSRQEAMECEPVLRRVSDAASKYDKPVYCLFIAVQVDANTAETFRRGIWYKNGSERQRLNIVPLTLKQFQSLFESMFESGTPDSQRLLDLITMCIRIRDMQEAPYWLDHIGQAVDAIPNGKTLEALPRLSFGASIQDGDGLCGCVVGMDGNDSLIVFNGTNNSAISRVPAEDFVQGKYKLL